MAMKEVKKYPRRIVTDEEQLYRCEKHGTHREGELSECLSNSCELRPVLRQTIKVE